jgi:glycerol-3-phosphate O-acyltransferase
VAERLAEHDPDTPVDEDALLDRCAAVGQQLLLQGKLHGPESLSRELFASAVRLASNRGLLAPSSDTREGQPDLATRRRAFAAEVRGVVERVVTIDETDATNRQESAGVRP